MFRALRRTVFNTKSFGVEGYALYLAARDPRTPRYVRILGVLVAAYVFSPIDIVPDVIPLLGLVDDFVVIPLGLRLVAGLIPDNVRFDAQEKATASTITRPRFWRWVAVITVIIVLFWLAMLGLLFYLILIWLW